MECFAEDFSAPKPLCVFNFKNVSNQVFFSKNCLNLLLKSLQKVTYSTQRLLRVPLYSKQSIYWYIKILRQNDFIWHPSELLFNFNITSSTKMKNKWVLSRLPWQTPAVCWALLHNLQIHLTIVAEPIEYKQDWSNTNI